MTANADHLCSSSSVEEGDDKYLALIRLFSAGASDADAAAELGLSKRGFTVALKKAELLLERRCGISGEALYAVLSPRAHGSKPDTRYWPRYSAPAVDVCRADNLARFCAHVEAVSTAQEEMDLLGLEDLQRWLSGWRPSNHRDQEDTGFIDFDLIFYIRPTGFRSEHMIGAVSTLKLAILPAECEPHALCTILLEDVHDPESSMVIDGGSRVAIPLDEHHGRTFEAFIKNHASAQQVKVELRQVPGHNQLEIAVITDFKLSIES